MEDRPLARTPVSRRIAPLHLLTIMSMVLAILAGGMAANVATPAAHAEAATGGDARFPSVQWMSWGEPGQQLPDGSFEQTETTTLGDQVLEVTCSVENVTRVSGSGGGALLEAYRPGTWRGDGFDDLYNIGGTGTDNEMIVGLSTTTTAMRSTSTSPAARRSAARTSRCSAW